MATNYEVKIKQERKKFEETTIQTKTSREREFLAWKEKIKEENEQKIKDIKRNLIERSENEQKALFYSEIEGLKANLTSLKDELKAKNEEIQALNTEINGLEGAFLVI